MAGTVPSLGDILRTLPQGDRSCGTYISILGATHSEQYTIQDMVSGIWTVLTRYSIRWGFSAVSRSSSNQSHSEWKARGKLSPRAGVEKAVAVCTPCKRSEASPFFIAVALARTQALVPAGLPAEVRHRPSQGASTLIISMFQLASAIGLNSGSEPPAKYLYTKVQSDRK